MEQDKQLKEILLNSAEKATTGFTNEVMKKVNGLSATPLHYQPLISPELKKTFLFIFGAVIAAILGLCLIITLTNLHIVNWIQNIEPPRLNYTRILIFILTFWMVFTVNLLLKKKFFFRKKSYFKIH